MNELIKKTGIKSKWNDSFLKEPWLYWGLSNWQFMLQ